MLLGWHFLFGWMLCAVLSLYTLYNRHRISFARPSRRVLDVFDHLQPRDSLGREPGARGGGSLLSRKREVAQKQKSPKKEGFQNIIRVLTTAWVQPVW